MTRPSTQRWPSRPSPSRSIAVAVVVAALAGACGTPAPDPVPAQPFGTDPAAPTGVISGVHDVAADLEARNDAARTP